MTKPKKLIEVAMPIKEISAESVRDKSIRHGHISTLHLWWARRPLPVSRAVVFATLVPDPLDENCPQAFRDAVDVLLGPEQNAGDPYRPYDDIPYTSIHDKMEDNLRNRLLMFIGKFSDKYIHNTQQGKSTPPKDQLSDFSLIKWESRTKEEIIGKARRLIWVAHNADLGKAAYELLREYDDHDQAIKQAENALYSLPDRHIATGEVNAREAALQRAIDAFLDRMPKVFDPFAGGGAIPLEAARLGCRSFGNDINPVAHIIQKGSLEFPQKFGKPIVYSREEFVKIYGEKAFEEIPNDWKILTSGAARAVRIPNRLSFDVEYFAKKLLDAAEKEIGHLYPADENGNKPIAYYWARVGTCSNPSCGAEVPLLKQFYLANTNRKKVYLHPVINGKQIDFEIREGTCPQNEGWNKRTNITCPICGNITDTRALKEQFVNKRTKERLLAVIYGGEDSKSYRPPNKVELNVISQVPEIDRSNYRSKMQVGNNRNFNTPGWGVDDYSELFSIRQLYVLNALVQSVGKIKEQIINISDSYYALALITYLGIFIDKIAAVCTTFGRWHTSRETIETPFSKQAIPMIFDYPEANIFSGVTGSALNQLEWILRYINVESIIRTPCICINASSGEKSQFAEKTLTAVVTDPPYYDAIAYADLSDFFYVWLKNTIGNLYPLNFATPQTPKADECTALKHHHANNGDAAREHFEKKLTQIFDAIEHQTSEIVSIMFAHQSTKAWTTLCNSILGARMNITGSWPMDTEMANRSIGLAGAALESSVTVSARPAQRSGIGGFREVRKAIEKRVTDEVEFLYKIGFRGADLLTACFGQAVSEFGRYQRVEKADGSEVTVGELLEMTKDIAFNALLKGFSGDDMTKFYIGWLQLYGFAQSDFDDAAKFTKVGLNINVQEVFRENILIKDGNKQTLATYLQRIGKNRSLGERESSYLIDQAHRLMYLYQGTDRGALLRYIERVAPTAESEVWRVLNSLKELLPEDSDDYKQVSDLLASKENLLREYKSFSYQPSSQTHLFEQN